MRRVLLQPLPRVCDHADALHEIVDPQGRNISGGSRGGQYVRRAGEVVADRLGRVAPHEDRARVADLLHEPPRLLYQQLHVLGRAAVRHLHGGVERRHQHEHAVRTERSLGDGAPRRPSELPLELRVERVRQRPARGDAPRAGVLVVLRLRDQIGRHVPHRGRPVGDDQHLGRPRQHVDPHRAHDLALRLGDEAVPGPHDLVHPGDRRRAVGQRRDRLGPAHPEDAMHARELGGRQHHVRHSPRRRHHDDVAHPGDRGGDRIHYHGGWIGRLASRDVDPDAVERHDAHQQLCSRRPDGESRLDLPLVISTDARHGELKSRLHRAGHSTQRLPTPGTGQLPLLRRQIDAVETPRVLLHRAVATRPHVGEDRADGLRGRGIRRADLRKMRRENVVGRCLKSGQHQLGSGPYA